MSRRYSRDDSDVRVTHRSWYYACALVFIIIASVVLAVSFLTDNWLEYDVDRREDYCRCFITVPSGGSGLFCDPRPHFPRMGPKRGSTQPGSSGRFLSMFFGEGGGASRKEHSLNESTLAASETDVTVRLLHVQKNWNPWVVQARYFPRTCLVSLFKHTIVKFWMRHRYPSSQVDSCSELV